MAVTVDICCEQILYHFIDNFTYFALRFLRKNTTLVLHSFRSKDFWSLLKSTKQKLMFQRSNTDLMMNST